ncbi:DMT family transporter [Haloprofundus salinisoli]|uniref:DMT family transporter n=1 Tax=Haloprofundus salinisoli TaxID=2876193 RepID=UPI001CCD456F|nr:EamA family transporter [Haloprofundus salinisoli]
MFRTRSGARGYAFALAPLSAAALWGGMYVVSKWTFAAIPPITLGFLRVALGALVLLAVTKSRGVHVQRGDYGRFVVLGGWVALTIVTQFVGTELTNASQGSLLTVLTPVFTVVLGVAVLDERLTAKKIGGMALAVAGTLLVVAGQYRLAGLAAGNLAGLAALVAASVAWAGYTVWGVPVVRRYSALTAATYATIAATPMLAVLSLAELATAGVPAAVSVPSLPTLAAVVYLGVAATAAAWYLWYKGLEYVGAGTVAVFFFAQPVVGAALGAALLGEPVGPTFLVGGLVMAAGVVAVSTARA